MESKKLLIVDDDQNFTNALQFAFGADYTITVENSFELANAQITKNKFDLILLDHHLEIHTGLELLQIVRTSNQNTNTPVLIITALPNLDMTIHYLNSDIQGFITKPIDYLTLARKIEDNINSRKQTDIKRLDWVEINYQLREVIFEDTQISLTPTELSILDIFVNNPGKTIQREDICKKIWGDRAISRNSFDTHLLNLRKKLPPLNERLISIYGNGYILN